MRNALDESARQAMRAAEIIRHQREFVARGETEQRHENIRRLVEEAGALALVGSRERGVNWVFEFAPEAGMVLADRVQIQQVLVNLMRNAMEAMRDSNRRLLQVRTLARGDRVVVEGFQKFVAGDLVSPISIDGTKVSADTASQSAFN